MLGLKIAGVVFGAYLLGALAWYLVGLLDQPAGTGTAPALAALLVWVTVGTWGVRLVRAGHHVGRVREMRTPRV